MTISQTRRVVHQCQCAACRQQPRSRVAREHQAINRILATLDEKSRRRLAGLLALSAGRGGVHRVREITGLSRTTIRTGREEIRRTDPTSTVRRAGGGRKAVEKNAPRF